MSQMLALKNETVGAQYSALLSRMDEEISRHLVLWLGQMFDRADDVFFDLAEKAGGTREQQDYFEAMRVLRRQRREIENGFQSQLTATLHARQPLFLTHSQQPDGCDELSLLSEDELEENLAIEGMAGRAAQRSEDALQQWAARYGAALGQDDWTPAQLPCHPLALCEALRRGVSALALATNVKLVIYKLFEREVLAQLPALYALLNQSGADGGLLPRYRSTHKTAARDGLRRETRPAPESSDAAVNSILNGLGDTAHQQLLQMLHELLAAKKLPAVAQGIDAVVPLKPVVETPQLLDALSRIQHDAADHVDAAASADGETPSTPLVRHDLRQLLAVQLPGNLARLDSNNIGVLNDDVIDIVSMMFDYILGDANLADEIKAQLARLQIPLLKLALNDREFFSNRNHPARLLLNEMAYAGIGWNPERRGKDGLQGKITALVQQVLTEFDKDSALFEALLADFRFYVEEESRRSQLVEKRTREAEEGKARVERARQDSEGFLRELMARKAAPACALAILEHWGRVLQLEHLRAQGPGEQFRHYQRIAVELLQSLDIRSEQARAELPRLIAILVPSLRQGLLSIGLSTISISELLQQLEMEHRRLLQSPVPEPVLTESVVGLGADFVAFSSEPEELDASIDAAIDALNEAQELEPQGVDIPEAVWARVDQFPVGSWLQAQEADGRVLRCKLAARIPPIGRYIFVNRAGVKILELQRTELALALVEGRVKLLDDGALFERALEAVVHNLRKLKTGD